MPLEIITQDDLPCSCLRILIYSIAWNAKKKYDIARANSLWFPKIVPKFVKNLVRWTAYLHMSIVNLGTLMSLSKTKKKVFRRVSNFYRSSKSFLFSGLRCHNNTLTIKLIIIRTKYLHEIQICSWYAVNAFSITFSRMSVDVCVTFTFKVPSRR